MAGVSGGLLAAETCRAGGLGFVAAGYLKDEVALDRQIQLFRAASDAHLLQNPSAPPFPLCLGFLGFAALATPDGWDRYERILRKHQPDVVQFFAPTVLHHPTIPNCTNVDLAHQQGALFLAQIGQFRDLSEVLAAKADGVVAQGGEAGGHGLRPGLGSGTLPLASKIAASVPCGFPVVAAGGIVNGRGVAAALALCDGAMIGTRLWACQESIGNSQLQRQLINATGPDDVIRTTVFDAIENEFLNVPWPSPYDSVGSLRNETSDIWEGRPHELSTTLHDPNATILSEYAQAQKESNARVVKVLSGEGVGEIDAIEPAYDVLIRIENETRDALQRLSTLTPPEEED